MNTMAVSLPRGALLRDYRSESTEALLAMLEPGHGVSGEAFRAAMRENVAREGVSHNQRMLIVGAFQAAQFDEPPSQRRPEASGASERRAMVVIGLIVAALLGMLAGQHLVEDERGRALDQAARSPGLKTPAIVTGPRWNFGRGQWELVPAAGAY